MLAGPLRRDVPAAGGAPPAAPNLQGRCTTARHPQHMHSAMPTAGGSAAEPHGLGCWGLMSRVRDAQGNSQGTGHPVTPTFLRLPSCANLPWPQHAAGKCLEPTDQILLRSHTPPVCVCTSLYQADPLLHPAVAQRASYMGERYPLLPFPSSSLPLASLTTYLWAISGDLEGSSPYSSAQHQLVWVALP